jgi:hypothetical protein
VRRSNMLPVYRTGCLRFERQYPRPSFSVDPSRRAEATGLDMERLLSGLGKMPAYHGRASRHDVARLCTCHVSIGWIVGFVPDPAVDQLPPE